MTRALVLVVALQGIIIIPAIAAGQKVNQSPVVMLTAPTSSVVGVSVAIDGSATRDDSPIGPQQWLYTFGDGGATSGQGPVPIVAHTYTAAGQYTITLTVTDNKRKVGTAVAPIGVAAVVAPPDTTAPTIPTNLLASVLGPTSMTVTWNPSTDLGGSGIASYGVWMTNVLVQTILSGTTASFTALTCATIYSIDVNAVDVAGNASLKKNLTVQTSNCVVATPTTLLFAAPLDYATNVTACTVELRRGGDAMTVVPVATLNLGKPAAVGGEVSVSITTLVEPLPSGSYYAVVVATGPGGSTPSLPSAVFTK